GRRASVASDEDEVDGSPRMARERILENGLFEAPAKADVLRDPDQDRGEGVRPVAVENEADIGGEAAVVNVQELGSLVSGAGAAAGVLPLWDGGRIKGGARGGTQTPFTPPPP